MNRSMAAIKSIGQAIHCAARHRHAGRRDLFNRDHAEDVYVALRDFFDPATRQVEDFSRIIRADVKTHKLKRQVDNDWDLHATIIDDR
jgi:hypothetical protein